MGFRETEKEEVVKLEQSYAIEMLNITKRFPGIVANDQHLLPGLSLLEEAVLAGLHAHDDVVQHRKGSGKQRRRRL